MVTSVAIAIRTIAARCSSRGRRKALCAAALALAAALPASAANLLDARYDPLRDEILVEIIYRGTNPDHRFSLLWDPCRPSPSGGPPHTAARLVDQQGDDLAREDFHVTRRLSLAGLPCRPALVTLRLGPVSNATVLVPPER
jgi:hypothetical protein